MNSIYNSWHHGNRFNRLTQELQNINLNDIDELKLFRDTIQMKQDASRYRNIFYQNHLLECILQWVNNRITEIEQRQQRLQQIFAQEGNQNFDIEEKTDDSSETDD